MLAKEWNTVTPYWRIEILLWMACEQLRPHSHRKSHVLFVLSLICEKQVGRPTSFSHFSLCFITFLLFFLFPTLCFCLKFLVHFLVWDTKQNLGWTVPSPCTPKSRVTNAKEEILVDKHFQTISLGLITRHLSIQIKLEGEGMCLHSLLFCTRLCMIME